ncbi:AmmeMemoRadiSam system protein B [Roseiflexus sp.]|uniref:AmmeMemoRadiSam system protein B n=1 Tax=Roseiflexus sp. TaxID=2562120 RepID=UPI00398B9C17
MDIRPSPIAGSWYPANPVRLRREIDRYLEQADPPVLPGRVWGVLAPHAGLRYSGPVAAWAFACVRGGTPDIVVIASPWHRGDETPLITTGHAAYETPLGIVEVDADVIARLDHALRVRLGSGLARRRYDDEHAVEIELPFLQRVLSPFRLAPVMLADQRAVTAAALGAALAETVRGHDVLLVASSDLSHYEPEPVARQLDAELLRRVAAFDPDAVIAAEQEGAGYACGSGAIAAVLWACRALGADRVTMLRYGTSGDVEPAAPWVVGYGAAAIWQAA